MYSQFYELIDYGSIVEIEAEEPPRPPRSCNKVVSSQTAFRRLDRVPWYTSGFQ